jgi:Sec-independent protein translocase protein TatA
MLDNFGLGEFFFLALLALLFFGPERLPEIGARLGRWVGSLTQYSKAFMTEWREEALAIHDAVAEVKGIRDEIVAAQREISGTMNTAREDMVDGIDTAKAAVTGAAQDVTSRIQQQRLRAAQDFDELGDTGAEAVPAGDGSGTTAAVAKTQQVLADLQARRSTAQGSAASGVVSDATAEEAADQEAIAASPEEEERQRIRRLIEDGMKPKQPQEDAETSGTAIRSAAIPPDTATTAASGNATAQQSPRTDEALQEAAASEPAATNEPAERKETAFDRTQQVLENLRRRRAGIKEEPPAAAEVAEAAEEAGASEPTEGIKAAGIVAAGAKAGIASAANETGSPPPDKETAFDRTQQVLENLKKRRETKGREAAAPAKLPSVSRDDFEQLSGEVIQLRSQMEALRNEIQALRDLASQASAAMDNVSIEEVA